MERYKYEPLRDEINETLEFRLLHLAPGKDDDPLRGTFSLMNYRDRRSSARPPYEAISYVWGNSELVEKIEIGDRYYLPITKSLAEVLRVFRYPDKTRVLWADAICINQEDNEEKKNQVERMGTCIYFQATTVRIYLGERSNDSDMAGSVLQDFEYRKLSATQISTYHHDNWMTAAEWHSLANLFRRPWFHRVWVVQECALAKKATMHCGDWEINADVPLQLGQVFHQDQVTRPLRNMRLLRLFEKSPTEDNWRPLPLCPLLLMGKIMRALLSRDHLFAFLGIAIYASPFPSFQPNYDEPLESIVRRYGRGLLEFEDVGSIIYGAGLGQQLDRFPSWIPDWTSPTNLYSDADPLAHWKGSAAGDTVAEATCIVDRLPVGDPLKPSSGGTYLIPRKASPKTMYPEALVNHLESLLYVKGAFVDEIQLVGDSVGDTYRDVTVGFCNGMGTVEIEALAPFFNFINHIRQHILEYPTGEALDEVFSRTVICDQDLSTFVTMMVAVPKCGPSRSISALVDCFKSLAGLVAQINGFLDRVQDSVHQAGHSLDTIMTRSGMDLGSEVFGGILRTSDKYEKKVVACICSLVKYGGWSLGWEESIQEIGYEYGADEDEDEDENEEADEGEDKDEDDDKSELERVDGNESNQNSTTYKISTSAERKIFNILHSLDVAEELTKILELVFTTDDISQFPMSSLQELKEFVKCCITHTILECVKVEHAADYSGAAAPRVSNEFIRYTHIVRNASQGRKLCLSAKGYVGLVPETTKPGDSIAILCGVKTPFIIRKRSADSSYHRVVGCAYIHGMMNGEALQMDDFKEEGIVLR